MSHRTRPQVTMIEHTDGPMGGDRLFLVPEGESVYIVRSWCIAAAVAVMLNFTAAPDRSAEYLAVLRMGTVELRHLGSETVVALINR